MFNVSLSEENLKKMQEKLYVIEHSTEMISIRGERGETLGEIIFIEESNEILVMTEDEVKWGKKIENIEVFYDNIVIFLANKEKMHKIEIKGKSYYNTMDEL